MKAIVYSKKGTPHKLILREIEKPVPGDNEVLIRINAVSLNAADYRSMKMGLIPRNKIFGADIAGIIESAGKNITLFRPGDVVMGDLTDYGFGGLAQYVTAPEKALVPKPQNVSFEAASTLPLAGITALLALRNKGNIRKGEKVLVLGSAGSVGPIAVQLAKHFGAEVTGVCSTRNIDQTLSIGADHVIDYTKENPLRYTKHYNLILGINGNYPLLACRRALAPGGRYVMVGGAFPQIFRSLLFGRLLSFGSKKMMSLAAKPNRQDLEFLASLLANSTIKPVIDRQYPLEKTAEAMEYMAMGHASGKVVISVEKS